MAGTHKKGTTDADGNGKQGGSLPEGLEERVAKLEAELSNMRKLARINGWSHA